MEAEAFFIFWKCCPAQADMLVFVWPPQFASAHPRSSSLAFPVTVKFFRERTLTFSLHKRPLEYANWGFIII